MNTFVYSFEDTSVTLQHPDLGSYSAYGTGIGSVQIQMQNDIATHEVAADLSVVISKSCKKNGTVNFEILQSSDFNNWLKKFYNYVCSASADRFALATMIIKSNSTNEMYTCTGVTPQKLADDRYQSESQNRTWSLMCANIEVT